MSGKKRNHKGHFTGGRYMRETPGSRPGEPEKGSGPSVADPVELPPYEEPGEGVWIDPTEEAS